MTLALFLGVLIGAILLGLPVAFALLLSSVALMLQLDTFSVDIMAQSLINGIDSFPLLAIPFFLVAGEVMRSVPDGDWGKGPVSRFMRRIGRATAGKESDLLSFLFFDARYTKELIELGYQDTMKRTDELEAFFS